MLHTVSCCAQASGVENHWSVREAAARLAALVCAKYGEPYYQIQPRITQALNSAFQQTNNPLNTHYGALCSPSICFVLMTHLLACMALNIVCTAKHQYGLLQLYIWCACPLASLKNITIDMHAYIYTCI